MKCSGKGRTCEREARFLVRIVRRARRTEFAGNKTSHAHRCHECRESYMNFLASRPTLFLLERCGAEVL